MMPTHTVEAWRAALAAATPQVGERLQKYVNLAHPPELADFVMQHARAIAAAGSTDASPDSPRIVDQDALATWNLLLDGKIVLFVCSSPGLLNDEQAIELANIALTSDEMFDTKLLRRMLDQRLWPEEVPLEEVMRTLVIVESLPTAGRLAMMLLRFSKHPHPWIQSKTSKILGRCLESAEVVEDLFENADPRVRANLIEGVSLRERQPSFLPLVEKACRDQHHRVSSIALAHAGATKPPAPSSACAHAPATKPSARPPKFPSPNSARSPIPIPAPPRSLLMSLLTNPYPSRTAPRQMRTPLPPPQTPLRIRLWLRL
jgi:hypothetical protein